MTPLAGHKRSTVDGTGQRMSMTDPWTDDLRNTSIVAACGIELSQGRTTDVAAQS